MNNHINIFLFVGAWIIVPLIIDILYNLYGCIIIIFTKNKKKVKLEYEPYVSIVIPVYNTQRSLGQCIDSIIAQNYPLDKIELILVDNGSTDNSHNIFLEKQGISRLKMWWLESSTGRGIALNKGIYLSNGKYIFNIDSDGILHKDAILNCVLKLENSPETVAVTGSVLTDYSQIKNTKGIFKRLLQKLELFEYGESFLIGRAFQSKNDSIFNIAGAFSVFRKEAILKTQLYNKDTIGEDAHMTAQIRKFIKGKIELCSDAYIFVEPIDNFDTLYKQRQRWQIGEIEVASLFNEKKGNKKGFNILKIALLKDHTLVFPRLIWVFATVYLIFYGYPIEIFIIANFILYILYMLMSFLNFFIMKLFIKESDDLKNFLNKNFFISILMPLYRSMTFMIRAIGIINSYETGTSWNRKSFSDERTEIKNYIFRRNRRKKTKGGTK
ncbi:MAG: TIGR03111 family XrtG-associated glycosyltransferase [Sarcina sp.]